MPRSIPPHKPPLIIKLYLEGKTLQEISSQIHSEYHTIRRVLEDAGIYEGRRRSGASPGPRHPEEPSERKREAGKKNLEKARQARQLLPCTCGRKSRHRWNCP